MTDDQGWNAYIAYADFMISEGIWAAHAVTPWSALSPKTQDAWRAAAAAVQVS